MAKIAYSKLNCKLDIGVKIVNITPDVSIEVKQYLPIQEKLSLIGRVIELAHEQDQNYSNPVKAHIYMLLEMIFAYTNISFTDKQKEDISKLYDHLYSSGILEAIIKAIPEEEYKTIEDGVKKTTKSFYKYQNSVLGLLDNLSSRNNGIAEALLQQAQEVLQEGDNLDMVKSFLSNVSQ